jgi:hypothetical protein
VAFLIQVFNSNPVHDVRPAEVRAAITESNYVTLCAQYGLSPALIPAAKAQLQVLTAPSSAGAPFFTVSYGAARPVVVEFQDWDSEDMGRIRPVPEIARPALAHTAQVVAVSLEADQLQDLGLLLGYELARWAAVQGQGIMRALDSRWYRLNAYKAFLPLEATP